MRNSKGQFVKGKQSGKNNAFYGRKHTKQSRKKMSKSLKGRKVWNKGKKLPEYSGSGNPNWKGGKPKCVDCGKKLANISATRCPKCYINNPDRIEKFQKKMRGKLVGEKNPFWKGGVSKERTKAMGNYKYKVWRESVYKRDDYTCQLCGIRSGNGKKVTLNAHHIVPWRDFPQFRYDIKNGVTLCKSCHAPTIKKEFLYIPKFLNI